MTLGPYDFLEIGSSHRPVGGQESSIGQQASVGIQGVSFRDPPASSLDLDRTSDKTIHCLRLSHHMPLCLLYCGTEIGAAYMNDA